MTTFCIAFYQSIFLRLPLTEGEYRVQNSGTERTRTIYTVFHCLQVTNFCHTKVSNKKICVWLWVFLEDGVAGLNRYKYSVTEHWLTHYPFYYLILCRLLPIWFLITPPGKWGCFSAARKNNLYAGHQQHGNPRKRYMSDIAIHCP